jgi:hypothetical protein
MYAFGTSHMSFILGVMVDCYSSSSSSVLEYANVYVIKQEHCTPACCFAALADGDPIGDAIIAIVTSRFALIATSGHGRGGRGGDV